MAICAPTMSILFRSASASRSRRVLCVTLALLLPWSVACGDPAPTEPPGPTLPAPGPDTPDASTPPPPGDAGSDGGTPTAPPPDAGTGDAGSGQETPPPPPPPPAPLGVTLSAPPELLVRSGGSAPLRVGLTRTESFSGPVTVSLHGLPPGVFAAERSVADDTQAVALVLSASEQVGPGTRIDATLVATAHGRSTSRPLRLLISGAFLSMDPTFPVVPLGWSGATQRFTVQADGKLLVARPITSSSGSGSGFVLERHHADGAQDLSFGTLGSMTHERSGVNAVHALTPLASGGVLVASAHWGCGDFDVNTPCTLLVSRHLPTGALDTTFGGGGFASARFGYNLLTAPQVRVDAQGRVSLVASYVMPGVSGPMHGVQRWDTNGTSLAGFGTEGHVMFPMPSGEKRFAQLRAVLQHQDESLTLAVTLFDDSASQNHGLLFGQVDLATGSASWRGGENTWGMLHREVVVNAQGQFVSLISRYAPTYDLIVRRYDWTGTRVYTSPREGTPRLLAIGSANSLFFDASDTPYTVGTEEGGSGLAVIRFTREDNADPGFGVGGVLRLDSGLRSLSEFTREPNGALLARTWPEPGLIRLWP
ncbi:hypothetical protein [Archangium primigenium]|uniref:hypothetical protein n=1 Tax=[Archangium] primigenium TaxID=2792470 RepID=UPI0019585AB0|nr:hypothetical protein [Archangium primigenium]MBM7118251.1 hypothetical protein [Archangium primigenium]